MTPGYRHHNFVAIRPANKRRDSAWVFQCVCGKQMKIQQYDIDRGHYQSCGCLTRELIGQANARHGMHRSPEYHSWQAIIQRCTNPKQKDYQRYGARGISVASEWTGKGGFASFLAHIGRKPTPSHSVDRVDNSRGYEPGNVRWATPKQQASNRRPNSGWARKKGTF